MKLSKSLWLGLFFTVQLLALQSSDRLINGKPVEPGTFEEVIQIRTHDSLCSATVVGPRTLITAAHCAPNGATAEFKVKGVSYAAKIVRSNLFVNQDHDISVGITDKEITAITPASVGGVAKTGLGITLLGYGCTDVGGNGKIDGVLRYGETVVTGFSNFDMVSQRPNGAALCFGDSGGPAFVFDQGQHLLIGINSKGNIYDTNYNTRTDIKESLTFLKSVTVANNVEICGINKNCGTVGPNPVAPSCQIIASPDSIVLGQSLTASIQVSGDASEAKIDNQTVTLSLGSAKRIITPTSVGSFLLQGRVSGAGGMGSCSASYEVKEKPPTPVEPPQCLVNVTPSLIPLGQSVVAKLTTQGQVTSAELNGQSVSISGGEVQITPSMGGNYSVKGKVVGPGGTHECFGPYSVEGPTPNVPNYTIIPTFCGDNTIIETQVKQVCLGVVKFSYTVKELSIKDIMLVTYRDGSQDLMPLLNRSQKTLSRDNSRAMQQWIFYANNLVLKNNNTMLDTRIASVTLGSSGSLVDVPLAISGRTIKGGQAFNVELLKKVGN